MYVKVSLKCPEDGSWVASVRVNEDAAVELLGYVADESSPSELLAFETHDGTRLQLGVGDAASFAPGVAPSVPFADLVLDGDAAAMLKRDDASALVAWLVAFFGLDPADAERTAHGDAHGGDDAAS
jgi:hypothetical protein